MNSINHIFKYLFFAFPIAFVTGPFFTDFFLVLISIFLLLIIIKRKIYYKFKNIIFLSSILISIFLILSSLISEAPRLSLESSLFYFRFPLFAFAVAFFLDENFDSFKIIQLIIGITIYFLCFNSIFQYFIGYDIFGNQIHPSLRVSGILGEELILGNIIFKLYVFFIFFYTCNKKKIFSFVLIFLSTFIVIFLSGERTSFVYFILFNTLIIFFIKEYRSIFVKYTIPFMILILILLLSFFPNHKERFIDNTISQLFNTNKTTLSNQEYYIYSPNHEALIKTSIEIFKDNIFFGAGPKTFRYHCSDPKYMKQVEYWNIQKENIMKVDGCSSHPHNAYIQLMAETGLFGFTIIFSIFLYVLVNLIKIKKSDIGMQKSYESNIIVLCALFIIVFPFLPTGNFFNNYSSAYIFFIFGLYLFTFKKLTKLRKIIK